VTQFARDLLAHLRQLIVVRTIGEAPDSFAVTAGEPERLRAQAESLSDLTLGRSVDVLSKALADIREGDEPRMTVELALLRCARPSLDASKEALAERIERLERGAGPAGDPPTQPEPASETVAAQTPGRSEGQSDGAPQATAVKETVDLEKLVGLWPAVLEEVRDSGSGLLSQILSAARPVAVHVDEAVLEVGFPASAAFNKRKAEATDARDRFADAVRTIVGERLRPVYVLLETDDAPPQDEANLSEEELVELLRAEFDAEEYVPDDESGEDEAQAKEA
jgi:DNA polymerase III gamma/tau subunit